VSKDETIRRLRLGNLRTLFRNRYGAALPDDDAGREDMRELLLPVSISPNADIKMAKMIEVWAPWMDSAEAQQLIEQINCTPIYHRKPTAERLGLRQQVTNQERERLRIWTIAAHDMTAEERKEQRRAKAAARKRRQRSRKPRAAYLAGSIARAKPWEKAGVSRATWYRQNRETGVSTVKLLVVGNTPVSPSKRHVRKSGCPSIEPSRLGSALHSAVASEPAVLNASHKLSSYRKSKPNRAAERK
jgi:hypothetical protein